MQEELQFHVRLVNISRYYVGLVLVMLTMIFGFNLAMSYIPQQAWSAAGEKLALGAVFVGSSVGPFILWRRWAISPAVITIGTDQLTVEWLNADESITIAFADVRSYGTTSSRPWTRLSFNLANGAQKRIAADELLAINSNFWEVVRAVNEAAARYQAQTLQRVSTPVQPISLSVGPQPQRQRRDFVPMSREQGFFERRSSTGLFIFLTVVVGLILLINALMGEAVGPMLALLIAAWVFYLLAWLLGMDARIRDAENDKS